MKPTPSSLYLSGAPLATASSITLASMAIEHEEAMEKMKPLREMVDAGHRCRSRAVSWSRHGRHLLGCQGGSGCMPRANWNDNNMARKKSPIDLK